MRADCGGGWARRPAVPLGVSLAGTAAAASFPVAPTGAGAAVRLDSWLRLGRLLPPGIAQTGSAFGEDPPSNTHRNPTLLLRLSGVLLLRFEDNRWSGLLLFHEAPRNTRDVLRCRRFSRASSGQRT